MSSQNIFAVYQLANAAERVTGLNWYSDALRAATAIAKEYSVNIVTVAGVIAALSPRNRWERNLADASALIKAFSVDPKSAADVKVCTFNIGKTKALKILADGQQSVVHSIEEVLGVLSGPKVCEFASCILGDETETCIDGHAYSVWFGDRITLNKIPKIGKKLRATIKADYCEAAKQLGIKPSELQAITWCAWRRLHGVTEEVAD
jgi:hypothetical protein